MGKTKLHFIDPALKSFQGHMAGYAAMVDEQFSRLGYDTTLYGHLDSAAVQDQLPVKPVFRAGSFDMVVPEGPERDQTNFFEAAKYIAADLLSLSRGWGQDPNQAILCNTLEPITALALAIWRRNSDAPNWPIAINAGLASGLSQDLSKLGRRAQYFQYAFKIFDEDTPLIIYTHSKGEQRDFKFLSQRKPARVPWPVLISGSIKRREKRSEGAFRILVPGAGHSAQNSKIFGPVIDALIEKKAASCHFLVQGPVQERQVTNRGQCHIEFVPRGLSPDGYNDLYASADCCLLPYLRGAYRATISGQFALCAMSGLPSIVTAQTTMSEMGADYPLAVRAVDETSPAEIADAIIEMHKAYSEVEAQAKAFQSWFVSQHGPQQHCAAIHTLIQDHFSERNSS